MNSAEQTTLTIKALRELSAERKRRAGSHALKGPHQADRREALRAEGRDADRLAATLAHRMPAEGTVRLHLDFKVGTLQEIGLGGLQVPWVDAKDEETGIAYDLTCGAGVANSFLTAGATRNGHGQYARATITPLARTLFDYLERRLAAAQDEAARQAVEEVTPQ